MWTQNVHKNCTFFRIYNTITTENAWKMGHIGGSTFILRSAQKLQKIAKNWHFFGKKAEIRLFSAFWAISWQIYGTYAGDGLTHESTRGCTKIDIFLESPIHFYWKRAISWDICGSHFKMAVHKNCNFFQLFWRKSLKIEEISTFWVKFRQIMGHMRDPQDAQKLQFFSEFGAQIAQNRRNWALFGWKQAIWWDI